MLLELVSGRKRVKKTRQAPESHINSQIVHSQDLRWAAKPPTTGPNAGPQTAETPQTAMP